jgi:hypothetical protein
MKILFVSQYFYPETFRGNDIVFDLVSKGHEVTVLCGKPNYPLGVFYQGYKFWGIQNEQIKGVNVVRTPTLPRGKGGATRLILNYISFILFSFFHARYKVDKDYDVIFVQQLSPVTMALPAIWALKRNNNAKLYLWVLDLWPESVASTSGFGNKFVIGLLGKLIKYIYSKAHFILISSKYFEESIKLRSVGKKIIYFPNWAESLYENQEINEDLQLPILPDGFNIMFAGNIGEAQDFETILLAANLTKNENINWIIIGDGRKLPWVRNEVEVSKLHNVHVFGRYAIEKMPIFFRKADVMLLSLKSSPISELTVPAKLQAYLASSKIVLGAINGETQSIINNYNVGLASDSGDYISLSQNAIILKNLTDQQKIKIERNSKNLYNEQFSKNILLDKLEKIFKNQLEN